MIFVLDASVMIAFPRDEPGADAVEEALLDSGSQCYAHALNLCEVFYDFIALLVATRLCKPSPIWSV